MVTRCCKDCSPECFADFETFDDLHDKALLIEAELRDLLVRLGAVARHLEGVIVNDMGPMLVEFSRLGA